MSNVPIFVVMVAVGAMVTIAGWVFWAMLIVACIGCDVFSSITATTNLNSFVIGGGGCFWGVGWGVGVVAHPDISAKAVIHVINTRYMLLF